MDSRSAGPASRRTRPRRGLVATVATAVLALGVMISAFSLAVAESPSFPDVPSSHPYHAAITALAAGDVVSGYVNGNFGPNDPVMRQQFAKMVVLAGGYPVSEADVSPFLDVEVSGPSGLYPDNYIAVCAARGITVGKTATTFDPYSSITRLQVISMVVRAADDLRPGLLQTPPDGWVGTHGWDLDATHGANAARAEYSGLLTGLDLANLGPQGNMTRGEVAHVLYNLLALLAPATTTTTTSSSTTTTVGSTTPPGSGTTSTTTPQAPPTEYSVAGLEAAQITATVRDQFGNPMPNIEVFLTSEELEGSGLTVVTDLSIGKTDAYGNAAYIWTQSTGDWGVEQMTAWVYSSASPDGIILKEKLIHWIYDDRGTDYVGAVAGQQKVTVVSGYAPWYGLTLKAYLNPTAAELGKGTYTSSSGLSFTTGLQTWVATQAFFVGAVSTNTDGKPNWMYNLVP